MPSFGKTSKERLATCHPDIQRLMNEVIKRVDITILCGHRGEVEQNAAFKNHTSQLKWPRGKHNKTPALAVDIAPYPVDWDDEPGFYSLAVIVKCIAMELKIPIKWGGDWESFKDLPHYEL
jgi:hypothetical protein